MKFIVGVPFKLPWLFFLLFFPLFLAAQQSPSVYFEVGGSGGFGSLNYEKCFLQKGITNFTFRAGISYTPIDKNNGAGIIFPILVNAQIGKGANRLELGIGQGITITTKGSFFILMPVVIGWRYQKADKNLFYRVSYTPLISYLVDRQYQNWGGISIGYMFKTKHK